MAKTRTEKKEEAVKRMKALRMLPQPIKEFAEEDKLNLSENGLLYWLNEDQQNMVKEFEEEHEAVVYHVIHQFTNIGEMYSLLYVSDWHEEWEDDMDMLKEGMALAYVVNVDMPDCSELGTIGVKPMVGGVARTW